MDSSSSSARRSASDPTIGKVAQSLDRGELHGDRLTSVETVRDHIKGFIHRSETEQADGIHPRADRSITFDQFRRPVEDLRELRTRRPAQGITQRSARSLETLAQPEHGRASE